jgi:hypothetical protein
MRKRNVEARQAAIKQRALTLVASNGTDPKGREENVVTLMKECPGMTPDSAIQYLAAAKRKARKQNAIQGNGSSEE